MRRERETLENRKTFGRIIDVDICLPARVKIIHCLKHSMRNQIFNQGLLIPQGYFLLYLLLRMFVCFSSV